MIGNKYDLICSIGGNCSAAHNLRYKNLRSFSLPFDWLYIENAKPLEYLSEGIANNFKDFCKKENLINIPQNEAHKDCVSYFDSYTNYYFVNHFKKNIEDTNEFEIVNKKNNRRIERLFQNLSKSKKVLFLLYLNFELNVVKELENFSSALKKIYPNLVMDFYVIQFNCKVESSEKHNNICIAKYKRAMNNDDFCTTNKEWNFLNKINVFHRFFNEIKNKIIKSLISLIPIKKYRKQLRSKYNV